MGELFLPDILKTPMFVEDTMTIQWQEFFRALFIRVGSSSEIPLNLDELTLAVVTGLYNTSKSYDKDIVDLKNKFYHKPSLKPINKLDSAILIPLIVANIDNPVELANYQGDEVGTLIAITEADANANEYTIYAWDDANAVGAFSPYIVAGLSGFWNAVGGKYINSEVLIGNNFTIGKGVAATDYTLTFHGQSNSGVITWMEDEDYFRFSDDILMDGGTVIFFRNSNGWIYSGGADLISIVVRDIQLYSNAIDLGRNGVDADTILQFMSNTNDGVITWKNTEDYFQFSDDILIVTDEKVFFRDTAIGIYSQADLYLDLFADGAIRIGDSSGGAPTNYTEIKPDGEINLHGTARVIKELVLNVQNFAPGASGATAVSALGRYPGWAFTIGDDMIASFEMPFDWDTSTDLEIKIYWYINEAYVTNSGEVRWSIDWAATPPDNTEAIDAPTHLGTHNYDDQDIPANAKYLTKSAGATIAAASLAAGDLVGLNINRIALTGGNNPTAEPVMVRLEIEYTSNRLGEAI